MCFRVLVYKVFSYIASYIGRKFVKAVNSGMLDRADEFP